jgi:hypothetical protein
MILTPNVFLLTTFRGLFRGGVATALRLPAQVLEDRALGPLDESSSNSTLGVWAKIGTTGIGVSPSKPGMCEMKLFRACNFV